MSTKQKGIVPTTQFYQQDIVRRITSPTSIGIVLRCWYDAEDVPPPSPSSDPMMRPLAQGEVGVSFLTAEGGEREILSESSLMLVDRCLQPGDFCKRSIDDARSGVVTNVHVKGRIEHVITGESIGWRTLDELENKLNAEIGDYVVYDDWIGQVIELYDESTIEVSTGELVRLPELSSRLVVGEKGTDILPPPSAGMHNFFGFLMAPQRSGSVDTVIATKHTVYAIAWLAVNQSLDIKDAEGKMRPQRFWYGEDIRKLTMVRGRSDLEMRVGDRVRLKDNTGLPSTQHGHGSDSGDVVTVQTFMVKETETTLHVLWQDGTKEALKSTEVIPYLNPDEYDCWPGDHVIWKCEETQRPAIIQHVNALDRTARILLSDSGATELASVLELDPHGMPDSAASMPPSALDGLGVRRGDFVLIHHEGTSNGFGKPFVPKIGELEAWVREGPFHEGDLTGWRKEMSDIGTALAERRGSEEVNECQMSPADNKELLWVGEVTNLNLDGTVEVTHPNWSVEDYPLDRLTKLYDGIEQLEDDLWGDDGSDSHESYADNDGQIWAMNEEGNWEPDTSGNEWEDTDDLDDEDIMDMDLPGWADEPMTDINQISLPQSITPTPLPVQESRSQTPRPFQLEAIRTTLENSDAHETITWKCFDVLPTTPHDHAFLSSAPAQPSKMFLGRLTREYRVLASSLPDSIFVRAYEDRADLLRCLILGPANTPYEDAPFLIDWMLDSNFPHSPPVAHFHSWTNGNGRVNPNLYEEGKVCLSILGTWAGDRNEIWNAARSSLLQAFISIQGLVLVKEPWFCEPAYDKLRGTEEGIVNSRLYNEKAYVLSRAFIRRALEVPLGGLEGEIRWLYYENRRLEKVLKDARTLITKSKDPFDTAEVDQDQAVPRLTAGGIITLERTLNKLQALFDSA